MASPCARGASATCFQRACSSRILRLAVSRFSSALSASISLQSSSCTCRFAQRCHSSASRSSCTRGPSVARAASSRACSSCRSLFDGSGARSSIAVLMSLNARSPAFSDICSAAASVSTCRATCWSRFRLSCSTFVLCCWCSCSFCSSVATACSRRAPASGLAEACSRSTSASRRRPRHRATISSSGCVEAISCSSSVASVSRRPTAACASIRRRSRASKARHASWKRRVSDAAYSDGIGGSPSHRTFSSAMRSIAAGSPPRPSISWQMATRSACSRATASARSRSAARSCCRSAIASRTASDADSNCCARAPSTTTSAWNSAQARRTSERFAAASSGFAIVTSASARCSSSFARCWSVALIETASACGARGGSSIARSFVRARRAATLLRARCEMAPSGSAASIRSSAATATSVCSDFNATFSSSSASVTRASARSRVELSAA